MKDSKNRDTIEYMKELRNREEQEVENWKQMDSY